MGAVPLADALTENTDSGYIPFDVPGHKSNLRFLKDFYGERCVELDKNSREKLDYLCEPETVIKQAQELAAHAFSSRYAWFMIGGTTSSVQAMVMSACSPGDKILLPRNVHISVINAVILADAVPVYIHPTIHDELGIALGLKSDDVKTAIENNPDAKAIVVNNPTYYGICSNLKKIIDLAHENNILVLADEAHAAHFYFYDAFPAAAMKLGADMSAVSMHKTGGSLTQSSLLLCGDSIDIAHTSEIINLTRTSSASYLLTSSLDLARRYMQTEGPSALKRILKNAQAARSSINEIDGLYAFCDEISSNDDVFDFDRSKLSVNTTKLGLTGVEVYSLLRDKYHIQIEFGDTNNILALCSVGDHTESLPTLIEALKEIAEKYRTDKNLSFTSEYIKPKIRISPRKAFFSLKKRTPLAESRNKISSGSVMCYPPGIPILAPGELVTDEIINHIRFAKEKGCTFSGLSEDGCIYTLV